MRALFAWAVDNCRMRLADDAVKAASRAQRGRSNAKRLDRSDANRTIECDGPRTDSQICRHLPRASGPRHGRARRGAGARVSFTSRPHDRTVWPLTDEPGACTDSVA